MARIAFVSWLFADVAHAPAGSAVHVGSRKAEKIT